MSSVYFNLFFVFSYAAAAFPVGRFHFQVQNSDTGQSLEGKPFYPFLVQVYSSGKVQASLPEGECVTELLTPSVLTDTRIEFLFVALGCSNGTEVLTLEEGNTWNLQWTNTDNSRYGGGIAMFQCFNECEAGSFCNSGAFPGKAPGECVTLGDWYPYGTFSGTARSGTVGGPLDSDPYAAELVVNNAGAITSRFGSCAGNSSPSRPNYFAPGDIEFVITADRWQCTSQVRGFREKLIHVSGDQWKLTFEFGDVFGEADLTFRCFCGNGGSCDSFYSPGTPLGRDCNYPVTDVSAVNDGLTCPLSNLPALNTIGSQPTEIIMTRKGYAAFCLCWSGICDPSKEETSSPPVVIDLSGQDIVTVSTTCGVPMVAQRQGEVVCFAYEHKRVRSDDSILDTCRNRCIAVGDTDRFQVFADRIRIETLSIDIGYCDARRRSVICEVTVEESSPPSPSTPIAPSNPTPVSSTTSAPSLSTDDTPTSGCDRRSLFGCK